MSRIDERLEAMQVDTSEMSTEEKFTAATGLTHYDEDMAADDWYVPGGAANVVIESEQQGEQGPQGPQGNSEPEAGEQGEQGPQGPQGNSEPEAGEQGTQGNPEPEPETYTITFMNGDEVVKTVTGEAGTDVSAPEVEKEGYEFNGWSVDGENPILPVDAIVDSDMTYVALWIKSEENSEPNNDNVNPSEIEVETEP